MRFHISMLWSDQPRTRVSRLYTMTELILHFCEQWPHCSRDEVADHLLLSGKLTRFVSLVWVNDRARFKLHGEPETLLPMPTQLSETHQTTQLNEQDLMDLLD